jgi:predicted enzyme related to lactoylglutathione lyase
MANGDSLPSGVPCWVELSSADDTAAISFYSELFGWEVAPLSSKFERYLIFYNKGRPVGACSRYEPFASDSWCVYLSSPDAGRTLEVAQYCGARLLSPALVVSHFGTMALIEDPGGAPVGVWQAGSFPGFSGPAERGDPSWFELVTPNWALAASFYDGVFGLETRAVGRGATSYAQLMSDGGAVAGIRSPVGPAPARGAAWSAHFDVEDIRGAMGKVIELGGAVLGTVSESHFGRRVEVADTAGARFHLLARSH